MAFALTQTNLAVTSPGPKMDSLSVLTSEERKRKVTEPLRDVVAVTTDSSETIATAASPVQEKKKKVYLTNGQAKKLQAELLVRVNAADDAALGSNSNAGGFDVGPLSPEQISAQKSAVEGKKMIPKTEVFKRLR